MKAKIAAASRRAWADPQSRARRVASLKAKVFSAEHRANLSAAQKGKSPSAETRAKMSAAAKARIAREGHRMTPAVSALGEVVRKKKWGTFGLSDRERKIRRMTAALMRFCIHRVLNEKVGGQQRAATRLGYTRDDVRAHLEARFLPGMTWENYGPVWVVDHIYPVAAFLKNGVTDPAVVSALVNLQPLWKLDNHRKSAKVA